LTAEGSRRARTGGCDQPQLATRRFSLGRARREQRSHLPFRAWVDVTYARKSTMPTGDGCVAINPESPSHNWQRTCPGVLCVRSGVLPTGQGLETHPRPQAITPRSPVPIPFPMQSGAFRNRMTVDLLHRSVSREVVLFWFYSILVGNCDTVAARMTRSTLRASHRQKGD
jgi:hypothetical protein